MNHIGFKIKIGISISKRDFTFGKTYEERTANFQQMLYDKTVKAIMYDRGGYGINSAVAGSGRMVKH